MAMQIFKDVMDVVYGKYHVTESGGKKWKPKTYSDNKSRYLWTDAFGVCNYLTLFYESSKEEGRYLGEPSIFLDQAATLIEDVHDTLGKERKGRFRLGQATDEHPTLGGLRIGKVHDEGMEDGDGQYFHYLTKWAFALNRMSLASKDPKYNAWAVEMLKSIAPHFVHTDIKNQPSMCWKMSIDLNKVVVSSEGNLDPYDGYVTYKIVSENADNPSVLSDEIATFRSMVEKKYKLYRSNDPLDLGEALWLCHWYLDEDWSKTVSIKSVSALDTLYGIGYFDRPLSQRLAFREFGSAIGVQCNSYAGPDWKQRAKDLTNLWYPQLYLRDRDITPIMFCSSVNPGVWKKDYIQQIQPQLQKSQELSPQSQSQAQQQTISFSGTSLKTKIEDIHSVH